MREFYLKNSLGVIWDLNVTESFFHDPTGFGFEKKTTYEKIGEKYVASEDFIKQKKPSGKINFSGYEKFEEFARFIQHTPIILIYKSAKELYLEVSIEKLEKDEIGDTGLDCDIDFAALGPYYIPISETLSPGVVGAVYPYTYDSDVYADNAMGTIEIESDSVKESPLKITILGPCTNPSWSHYLNGSVITTGKMNCSIESGHRLIVDATTSPYAIKEVDSFNKVVADKYQASDFSTERFVYLGNGTNTIAFAHEGSEDLIVIAEGAIYYDTL